MAGVRQSFAFIARAFVSCRGHPYTLFCTPPRVVCPARYRRLLGGAAGRRVRVASILFRVTMEAGVAAFEQK
jgi:hypothetical protein